MSQTDIAAGRGSALGVLPPAFLPAGDGAAMQTTAGISETIFITELTCEGRTFIFNHPLPVHVLQEEGGWSCESPEEYNLLSYGEDRLEAETSFRDVFAYCWDDIACEDDERLAEGAIAQKCAFLALVKTLK
jgi:predicted RNase H-like HicB family nuclease